MKHHPTPISRKVSFDEIEHGRRRAYAVNGEDFSSFTRATLQNTREDVLLLVKMSYVRGTPIEPDLADVTSLWKQLFPDRILLPAFPNELRMESERSADT